MLYKLVLLMVVFLCSVWLTLAFPTFYFLQKMRLSLPLTQSDTGSVRQCVLSANDSNIYLLMW